MQERSDPYGVKATRGPALTVLAFVSLASFANGLLGDRALEISPPQRDVVTASSARSIIAARAALPLTPVAAPAQTAPLSYEPSPRLSRAVETPASSSIAASATATPVPHLDLAPPAADVGRAAEVAAVASDAPARVSATVSGETTVPPLNPE